MRKLPTITPTMTDRLVGFFSPKAQVTRMAARGQIMALTGGYTGASRRRRQTKNWLTGGDSADGALLPDLPELRNRSRDLERNNPLARGALNTKVTNIVGTGLKPIPQIDAEALGLSPEEKEEKERALLRLWKVWAESAECDLNRTNTFAELQELVFRSVLRDGDVLVVKRFVERPGGPFGLKHQLIEADRLSNPNWQADTARLSGGVETDRHGAPRAYHVTNTHPGDYGMKSRSLKWMRLRAFGPASGRRNVLHIFRRLRVGQSRGEPDLAPVIEMIKQMGEYTDAEAQAAVVSAFFTVFVKSEGGSGFAPSSGTNGSGVSSTDANEVKLGQGAIVDLAPGEDIVSADPTRPNQAFDGFVLALARQIGTALELPFEILIKHFTASYSAARGALLEAWKYYRGRRRWLAQKYCQPTYEDVVIEAVARGMIDLPGFFEDPFKHKAWLGADWYGDGMAQIDPKKENEADVIAEERGWKTASEITAEKTGGDFEQKIIQRGREERLRKESGLAVTPQNKALPRPAPKEPEPHPDQPEDETEDNS